VMETAKQVKQLIDHWPTNWAPLKPAHVGVITATPLQAVKIRVLLKTNNCGSVAVYTIHEARNFHFRVTIYSSVWDRRSLSLGSALEPQDALFSTIITRPSSIVRFGSSSSFALSQLFHFVSSKFFLGDNSLTHNSLSHMPNTLFPQAIFIGNAQVLQALDKSGVWGKLLEICMQNNTFYGCDPNNFSYQVDTIRDLAPLLAGAGEHCEESPPPQSPTPSSVLSLASSVGGSYSPLGPTIGRTVASSEYSLPSLGSSNPWGVDDSSSIGSDLDLARSWSSTGVLALEPDRPRSLGVPASPLIGASSVFADSPMFADERSKSFGRLTHEFAPKNPVAGIIGSPLPGGMGKQQAPALLSAFSGIEAARQAITQELAVTDTQTHSAVLNAHLLPLVAQLAPPDMAQDIVNLLLTSVSSASELVQLMANASSFQEAVRQRAEDLRGSRMLSRHDNGSVSSTGSTGLQVWCLHF
jgi:hypothetical protein